MKVCEEVRSDDEGGPLFTLSVGICTLELNGAFNKDAVPFVNWWWLGGWRTEDEAVVEVVVSDMEVGRLGKYIK